MVPERDFFDTPFWIDCEIDDYCAFPGAYSILGVDRVYEKKLVDVGGGIMMSKLVVVKKELRTKGSTFYISLSHQGILAICSCDDGYTIQFTDILNDRQVEMKVENSTNAAFYDDNVILLTYWETPREAVVKDVFAKS